MQPDKVEPLAVTVKRARELTGLGNTTIYRLIAEKRLKIRRIAGVDRTLITFASLQKLLAPEPSENTATLPPRRPRNQMKRRSG
jgi:excisionase family DNA binding protein